MRQESIMNKNTNTLEKKNVKKILAYTIKKTYNFIPSKKWKKKIRNKVYYSNKLANIFMYEEKHHHGYKLNDMKTEQIHYYDHLVAVCLNIKNMIYLDYIVQTLKTLPYDFDLYLNCSPDFDEKKLEKAIKKNMYFNKLYVSKKDKRYLKTSLALNDMNLEKYEYVLNINTCNDHFDVNVLNKIIQTKYLFKNLIYLFHTTDTKLINFMMDSSERHFEVETSKKLSQIIVKNDISFNDFYYGEFKNYLLGDISFLSTSVLKMIDYNSFNDINSDYQVSNYYFEKIFKLLFDIKDFKVLFFDFNKEEFNYYQLEKTVCKMDKNKLVKLLNDYDIITFDIFDTLVTRKIYNPDDLFNLLDLQLKDKYQYNGRFLDLRKQAERNANCHFGRDVNIDEIYEEFKKLTKLDSKVVEKIKNAEIDLELEMIIPRNDMISIYNLLLDARKRIFVLTDMYLKKDTIVKILEKCGITKYELLWVSCDKHIRKDTGEMWDKLISKYPEKKIFHIGDNMNSDIKQASLREIKTFKVHSGREIADKKLNIQINSLTETVLYGNIFNHYLFNSPFSYYDNFEIKNCYQYGSAILSPIFVYYFSWLLKHLQANPNQHLLFVARDGYYLKKMYDYLLDKCHFENLKTIKYDYFLTSRRAASIATAKNIDDLFEILNTQYEGTLQDFFKYRFGVSIDLANRDIQLPRDLDIVKDVITKKTKLFLDSAKEERKCYLEYINSIEKNPKDNYLTFIDLGYSGTTQYYISKLLGKKTNGYYFLTSPNVKPLKIGCTVECCFNRKNDVSDIFNPLYQKTLLLESFLTAPTGQLNKFVKKGKDLKAIYIDQEMNKDLEEKLDTICKAILDSFEILIHLGLSFDSIEMDKKNIYSIYEYFLNHVDELPSSVLDIFYIEDFYCCNKVINTLN